jgi:hypothetical protein
MPYFHDWVEAILSKMTHSYKPILCLSIIKNVSRTTTGSQTISKETISSDVARFYWEIHDNGFQIRHGPTKNIVDDLVQQAIMKTKLNKPNSPISWHQLSNTLKEPSTPGGTTYLEKIWKKLEDQPFNYMNIPQRTLILTTSGIEIPIDSVRTINSDRKILYDASILKLIDFLGKFNRSNSPNISQKVRKAWNGGGRPSYPSSIISALDFVHPQPRNCVLQIKGKCTVIATAWDHVIPWSHIGDHDIWNLMPICSRCNSDKSNKKPIMSYIRKTETRNSLLLNQLNTNPPKSISAAKLQDLKVQLQIANTSSLLRTNRQSMP